MRHVSKKLLFFSYHPHQFVTFRNVPVSSSLKKCNPGKMSSQKTPAQKVVIPKGMIDPNETTVIEIPSSMRKRNVVVVKKTENVSSVSSKKGKRSRKTHRATTTRKFNRKMDDMHNQPAGSSQSPGESYQTLPKYPGLSHASFADFADDHQLDQLLEDLDRYYCTQKQMLVNAKLSRTSTCPCPPNTKFTQTDITIDNSNYESFKKGICPTKTSEPIPTQLSVSAPHSQHSLKPDSVADKSTCCSWNSAHPALKPHSSCSCSNSPRRLCQTTKQSAPHSQPLLTGQHLDTSSKMTCCSKPDQQNFTISTPSKQSCAILTPCDLELIRRQFEEASKKLQDILNSQKNDSTLQKKKKR